MNPTVTFYPHLHPQPILVWDCTDVRLATIEKLICELPDWLAGIVTPEQMLKLGEAFHARGRTLTEQEAIEVLGLG